MTTKGARTITPSEAAGAEYVDRARAAELAGVHVRTVDRWANQRLITRFKVGGRQWVVFRRSEIEAQTKPTPAVK